MPKKHYPDINQRANCLRLRALLETIDQQTYIRRYHGDIMCFLFSEGVKEFPFLADYDHFDRDDYDFEVALNQTFFDSGFLFFDHVVIQKWLVEDRLRTVANTWVPPPSRWKRFSRWCEKKLCCMNIGFDP